MKKTEKPQQKFEKQKLEIEVQVMCAKHPVHAKYTKHAKNKTQIT